jgi:hypothetical protein
LGDPDKDVTISCSSRFVARLYDQKSFEESLTVRHPYSIGEGRGGFARQEVCQTLVWNEARRICFRSGASEGGNITRLKAQRIGKARQDHYQNL